MSTSNTFKWLFYEGEQRNGMVAGREGRIKSFSLKMGEELLPSVLYSLGNSDVYSSSLTLSSAVTSLRLSSSKVFTTTNFPLNTAFTVSNKLCKDFQYYVK